MGKNVAHTGYSDLYRIARYSAELTIFQLVSEYMTQASGEDPGEDFVLSCQERNWAIVLKRAWTGGGFGKRNNSMFLFPGYVFV